MLNRFGRYGADDVSSTGRGGGSEWSSGRSQERLCYFDEKRKNKRKEEHKTCRRIEDKFSNAGMELKNVSICFDTAACHGNRTYLWLVQIFQKF